MSRYFPHTSFAEDQPLAKTILTTHVATRAVTTGTIIGMGITLTRQLIPSLRSKSTKPFATRLLATTSVSILYTLGICGVGLVGRMWGREDIEWQDRSWRLLESKGQVEVDDWTYQGMAAASATALVGKLRAPESAVATMGWKGLVGAAGLGSVGGVMGYMAWRYGVNGGKFPDKLPKKKERETI